MSQRPTVSLMEQPAIDVSIVCGRCGDTRLALTDVGGATPHAVCRGCAADLGAWDAVREHARAAMFDALREDLAGMLSADHNGGHAMTPPALAA